MANVNTSLACHVLVYGGRDLNRKFWQDLKAGVSQRSHELGPSAAIKKAPHAASKENAATNQEQSLPQREGTLPNKQVEMYMEHFRRVRDERTSVFGPGASRVSSAFGKWTMAVLASPHGSTPYESLRGTLLWVLAYNLIVKNSLYDCPSPIHCSWKVSVVCQLGRWFRETLVYFCWGQSFWGAKPHEDAIMPTPVVQICFAIFHSSHDLQVMKPVQARQPTLSLAPERSHKSFK